MQLVKSDIRKISPKDAYGLNGEWLGYLTAEPGVEHYALLRYLASQLRDSTIVELGTFKGVGTVALALGNESNTIISYDIKSQRICDDLPNVEFRVGDIFQRGEQDLLVNAEMVFVDANHDGDLEKRVLDFLADNHYKGLVVMDDITLNKEMSSLWDSITKQKYDLTDVGHGITSRFGTVPGTGLVDFGQKLGNPVLSSTDTGSVKKKTSQSTPKKRATTKRTRKTKKKTE